MTKSLDEVMEESLGQGNMTVDELNAVLYGEGVVKSVDPESKEALEEFLYGAVPGGWKTSTYFLIGTAVLAGIGALYYLSKPGPPESAIMKQDDLDDFTKDFSDEMEELLTLAENNAREIVDKVRAKDNKTYLEAITREADSIVAECRAKKVN